MKNINTILMYGENNNMGLVVKNQFPCIQTTKLACAYVQSDQRICYLLPGKLSLLLI